MKNGIKDGPGFHTWKTGETYEGQWKKGKINGQGTFTHKLVIILIIIFYLLY